MLLGVPKETLEGERRVGELGHLTVEGDEALQAAAWLEHHQALARERRCELRTPSRVELLRHQLALVEFFAPR